MARIAEQAEKDKLEEKLTKLTNSETMNTEIKEEKNSEKN